ERERRGPYADFRRDTLDHWEVFLAFQPGDDVQTGFGNLQSETVTKQLIKLFDEEISPLRVDFSHSLDMTEEKALGDKTRERCLFDRRRVLIHRTSDLHKRIDQLLWRDDVAQTQRRTEKLADCAGVNNSTGVMGPLL